MIGTYYEFNESLLKEIISTLGLVNQVDIEELPSGAFVFYEIDYIESRFLWKKSKNSN